jgi:hypothetical protein
MNRPILLLVALLLAPSAALAASGDAWSPIPAQPAAPAAVEGRIKRHLPVGISKGSRPPVVAELKPRRQTATPAAAAGTAATARHRVLKPQQPAAAPPKPPLQPSQP